MRTSALIMRVGWSILSGAFVMPSGPNAMLAGTAIRDYKLSASINFAHADWKTTTPKMAALQRVLSLYRYNVHRVRLLMLAPAQIAALATEVQLWKDIASHKITGSIENQGASEHLRSKIEEETIRISSERTAQQSKLFGTRQWDPYVREQLGFGLEAFGMYASSHAARGGIDAMLASYITGAWTAFEALAVDLWETALNEHPRGLASLEGKLSRLNKTKAAADKATSTERDSKSIPLDFVQQHDFNIRDKMGTIFLMQRRFEFTRLSGIRSAYVQAFSADYAQIDTIVSDNALDALSAVRNVLVHKAGIADLEYIKRTGSLTLPKLSPGNQIQLDGEVVVGLIKPVFNCGAHLIEAVDAWMTKHP